MIARTLRPCLLKQISSIFLSKRCISSNAFLRKDLTTSLTPLRFPLLKRDLQKFCSSYSGKGQCKYWKRCLIKLIFSLWKWTKLHKFNHACNSYTTFKWVHRYERDNYQIFVLILWRPWEICFHYPPGEVFPLPCMEKNGIAHCWFSFSATT